MRTILGIIAGTLIGHASANFTGVELINHASGPVLIKVTCFESGFSELSGVIAEGDRQALRIVTGKLAEA